VLWLFGGVFTGRVLYFRDLSSHYAPDYAFAAGALRQGLWPLWNPLANAGEPFLLSYPLDLVLLMLGGPRAPLGVGAALHLLLALTGATLLARRLGMGPWGGWLAGAVYGLGGCVLSTVNLMQLFQAAAWAPWVLTAFLAAARRPDGRRLATLAVLLALQASTLGVEIVLQTALVGLLLLDDWGWLRDLRLVRLLAAGGLALALAAPALLGVRALLEGTSRAHGFPVADALAFSLHPVVLAEALLPRLLGDPHAFSDAGYWGRAYFPEGYPYLVTLYVGVPAVLLALHARGRWRLRLVAALGVLLSLGRYGLLALVPDGWTLPFRGPQKLFFLTHTSLALLAGFGLESARGERARGGACIALALPGALLLLVVLALHADPEAVRGALGRLVPPLLDPRGLVAARGLWPAAWLPAGALALGAALALARGGDWLRLAAPLAVLDLLIANGSVNPLAPAAFYDLRPDVAALVKPAASEKSGRWFSYGVANTPGLRFAPIMTGAASDVWLYYLDRQSLLPRTNELDGLPGALDVDRTGWAPAGATLGVREDTPGQFSNQQRRLRLAAVRWVLAFERLPDDLVAMRGETKLPEVEPPLRLYGMKDALPQAFWVPRCEVEPDVARRAARLGDPSFDPRSVVLLSQMPPPGAASERPRETVRGPARVNYESVDAHTVRISASTPPGFLVVLDGFHPDWKAEDRSIPVPLWQADGRYRALPTAGGERTITLSYQPRWRNAALALAALSALACLVLAARR
jgi:hypothetical protein